MSLRPHSIEPVPEQTARIAQAAFPKGNLYMQMRQELGTFYTDADFATLYPRRGQPAIAPWRLALVTVMQFVENLSDRQAAEAVRARIDWKYALGLELIDPGFDFSILSEFRARLVEGEAEQRLLDRMLEVFGEKKLLKARGHQRTDSTHVLASIRVMNRLELVTETLRATLNDLASVAPDWLRSVAPAEWQERYTQRAEQSRLPKGEKARKEYAEVVGQDGVLLLRLLDEQQPGLKKRAEVETLRQVWARHFARCETGELLWRAEAELSRAATAIESPYDTEARHSNKRDTSWTGYKVHLTETCDADLPRIVTDVLTTVATTQDVACTADIQQSLADKNLLPARHLVDTGYVDGDLLVSSKEKHAIELFGPPREGQSWQAREGGYDQARFTVDWERERAFCPEGKASASWRSYTQEPYGYSIVKVRFAQKDCINCLSRERCVRSAGGQSRTLVLPARPLYEALQQTRSDLTTEEGKAEYRKRAGVEGSLSQGVRRSGMRCSRYYGLSKTHLQHLATAAALNVVRVTDYLAGKPLAKTRRSRFARLAA
ncbi:MAG TPA: IS1182 family transposase [Chthonomonadaceae bacterium]|nr:IS1182 family transposase [Chthonomonadaceae bacterium]